MHIYYSDLSNPMLAEILAHKGIQGLRATRQYLIPTATQQHDATIMFWEKRFKALRAHHDYLVQQGYLDTKTQTAPTGETSVPFGADQGSRRPR